MNKRQSIKTDYLVNLFCCIKRCEWTHKALKRKKLYIYCNVLLMGKKLMAQKKKQQNVLMKTQTHCFWTPFTDTSIWVLNVYSAFLFVIIGYRIGNCKVNMTCMWKLCKGSRKKSYIFSGQSTKRGKGVRGRPLRKKNFIYIHIYVFFLNL